jgi:uncharacterized membrane protein
VPGLIDLLSLRDPEIRRIAIIHMLINLTAVTLYGINIYVRVSYPGHFKGAFTLSVIGVGLIAVSGWIGGEIVHIHGVGATKCPA